MDYIRIQSIDNPLFLKMHQLMSTVFPPEEVLAFEKWKEPLMDPGIHVYAAVDGEEVVGATEYRYYPDMRVAMTDFTIVGRPSMGIGRFLMRSREKDIARLAADTGTEPLGMFAEIYDPVRADYHVGGITPMHPYVRREVLSHIGYQRLDFPYVHPSWEENGEAVSGLDLCFLPRDEELHELPSPMVSEFLNRYYSALPNKPAAWYDMIQNLQLSGMLALKPL
ncbi:GNAT family N-acetyltransferase [Paenibacillus sp. sptzw28]|uniref:GNAT family N-acetyltransferase n=1 Tax=Paenibacillus sp. sptzw28 TaxID=715179 RepID=UPI001C6F3287|nr:GNAT family N-acetyltransferase [Paenibacillus sp. sptzw28]QYR19015.1 GNAT family N-acetyltransferase [Paenibacillus sp. sptzw28]